MLSRRLALDVERATMNHWDKPASKRCFTDIKIYIGTFMYMGIVQTGYATSFFTPTILKQLGWTSIKAQVMSIPIFLVATVTALITAVLTDRMKHRFSFIVAGCCISSIGYAMMLDMMAIPVGARYFALYLIVAGGYIAQPVVIVWLSNNVSGHYKRGVSSAMQIGFGNLGKLLMICLRNLANKNRWHRCQQYLPSRTGSTLSLGFRSWSWISLDDCHLCRHLPLLSSKREQAERCWQT